MTSDKQQNIDVASLRAASSDAISSSTQPPVPPFTSTTTARRRELKPTLMSHISGVHRLSGGGGADAGGGHAGYESAKHLPPKYGVECAEKLLLDEVNARST